MWHVSSRSGVATLRAAIVTYRFVDDIIFCNWPRRDSASRASTQSNAPEGSTGPGRRESGVLDCLDASRLANSEAIAFVEYK